MGTIQQFKPTGKNNGICSARIEEMKYLYTAKEIPKINKILQFPTVIDNFFLIQAKIRIGKRKLDLNAKHQMLL